MVMVCLVMAIFGLCFFEVAHAGIEDGLVAHYQFNGDATDIAGDNDGAVYGAILTKDRYGDNDEAYFFNGTSDYIDCGNDSVLNITGSMTITAWVKVTSDGSIASRVRYDDGTWATDAYTLEVISGKIYFNITDGNLDASITTDRNIADNSWHFVAAVFDQNKLKVTIDDFPSVEQAGPTNILSDTSLPLYIGASSQTGGGIEKFINGTIDEVRLYNRALSESEVAEIYILEKPPVDIESDLIAHYKFDGDATDSSGNVNDGTNNGATLTADRFGQSNSAYSFDGDNDYIDIPDNFGIFDGSQNFTISLWVKPERFGGVTETQAFIIAPDGENAVLITTQNDLDADGYWVSGDMDGFGFSIGPEPPFTRCGTKGDIYIKDYWYYITAVYDSNSGMKFYVNADLKNSHSGTGAIEGKSYNSAIGGQPYFNQKYFKGDIDDVRIYNRALIENEIEELYTLVSHPSSLTMSYIPQDQQVNVPFSVTIDKFDATGNTDTSFNEEVSLFMEGASIDPLKVKLINGTKTFDVTSYTNGQGLRLQAHSGIKYNATSNQFNVIGTGLLGVVSGVVIDPLENPISGATVHLKPFEAVEYTTTTVIEGKFQFTDLTPGKYKIWASYDGLTSFPADEIDVATGPNSGFKITTPTSLLVGKPPVILVPGAMGSDTNWKLNYAIPELPKTRPAAQSDLKIHDPGEWTVLSTVDGPGWLELRRDLWDAGFFVVECPWDWRYHPGSQEAQEYLLSCINKAKSETGAEKVDVVAHSQGGLLTRAYIQKLGYENTELVAYRNDIDRFIMLGTPNHGSPLAYPLWSGGDTLIADKMAGSKELDSGDNPADYFYSHTLNKEYEQVTGNDAISFSSTEYEYNYDTGTYILVRLPPTYIIPPRDLRVFIRNNIVATRSLVPENDYAFLCQDETCTSKSAISDFETQNWWLTDLNNDLSHLTDKGVSMKIFGSIGESETIRYSRIVTNELLYDVYEDGIPYPPWNYAPAIELGDGTVPYSSLILSHVDSDALYKGDHARLPGNFRNEIVTFLVSGRDLTPVLASSMKSAALSTTAPSKFFSVSLKGPYGLVVIGPDGKKNGVDLDTDTLYEESPDVTVYRSGDGMSVSLTNAPDGTYQFTITGSLANRVSVTLGFMDEDSQEEFDTAVYFDGSSASFSYKLSATSIPALTLASSPAAPRYPVVKNQGGMALFSWEAPEDVTPASYAVYSRLDTEPFYTLLTTVSAAEPLYQTSHPVEDPKRFYVIGAIDSEGDVGILSRVISNQIPDQYHLAVLLTGTGNGTISSSIDGINCGFDCQEFYNVGQTITLTAVPDVGMSFLGWVGNGCSSTEEECTVTMDQARSISAVFSLKQKFPWAMFLPAITRGQ